MKEPQTVGEIVDRLPAPRSAEPQQGSAALMKLIERAAMSSDFDVAKLEKLLEVRDRWEATEARKGFVSALNAFKAKPPSIIKNKHVSFGTQKGSTEYDHATLDQVCDVIGGALSQHGLSHRWEVDQGEGMIRVTCVLTHELGHSERVSLQAGADQSGGKNNIQAIGSTVSYLSRYTLLAATGLAAKEHDDDGRSSEQFNLITPEQKDELIALLKETNADTKRYLTYMGVDALDEIPEAKFASAKAALEKKREKK